MKIYILIFTCLIMRLHSQIVSHTSFDRTFGSTLLDNVVKTINPNGTTIIFGSSNSTTYTTDIPAIYGGGDVFIAQYDSSGALKNTKVFGGSNLDKLLKVIEDNYGYWLFINSYSGPTGTRTLPQACTSSLYANNDLYILRLNKKFVQVAEYSCCMGIGLNTISSSGSVHLFNDIVLNTNKQLEIAYQERDAVTNLFTLRYIVADTTGSILNHFNISQASSWFPYIGQDKLKCNQIININDSISYVLGTNITPNFTTTAYVSVAALYVVNTKRNVLNVTLNTFCSRRGESSLKAGLFVNGKLHLYAEDVPLSSSTFDNYGVYPTSAYNNHRFSAAKTIANKKDIWCNVFDSLTFSSLYQYAIGTNDDTEISKVKLYKNRIYLGCSTLGGIAIDKTTPSKGSYDYWLIQIETVTNTISNQLSKGGNLNDKLIDFDISEASLILSGNSISNSSGDKLENSKDGSLYGDIWTIGMCNNPIPNFYADKFVSGSSELVTFTNTTTGAYYYTWDFGDLSGFYYDKNPVHYFYTPGFYTVFLNATSLVGCVGNDIKINYLEVLNPVVGLEELSIDNPLKVYPSVFESKLKIDSYFQINKISIYSTLGNLVYSKAANENHFELDLNYLSQGIYTIQLINNQNKTISQTIIKQ